jgi:cysteine synthase
MQAFGAEVELIPSPMGITPQLIPAMVRRARVIATETGAFWTDQFNNTDMLDGYRQLGGELLQQLPGPPDMTAFCSYVGTAGCFLGATGLLRTQLPPSIGWWSSQGSQPCSLAAFPAPTTSRVAASGRGRRCCGHRISTRW